MEALREVLRTDEDRELLPLVELLRRRLHSGRLEGNSTWSTIVIGRR